MKKFIGFLLILLCSFSILLAGDEWFKAYEAGIEAMKSKDYNQAIAKFREAMQVQNEDKRKIRTYGMHFIPYFPHRETGIAMYYLGNLEDAKRHLQVSMRQTPSKRAQEFLNKISGGEAPPENMRQKVAERLKNARKPKTTATPGEPGLAEGAAEKKLIVGQKTIKLVGERMGVAVMPFENKGASRDLGEIVLDKMITAFFNTNRFKVVERAQLESILNEQQLGMTGVIDASTAAEIGKGIGVDAIILGSVAAAPSGAISLDARAIDTETATIIVAHDAYSGSSDAQSVRNTVENLANKFGASLPLVEGYVIKVDGNTITLDMGRTAGLRKGLKCIVYNEGAEVKHPITGEVLGKETKILAEVVVTESFEKMSSARILKSESDEMISVGDKFLTK